MYQFESKNIRVLKRIATIIISLIVIVFGTYFLIKLVSGWKFDYKSPGLFKPQGILQINSNPTNASLYVNNQKYKSNTKIKMVASPGDYDLRIEKDKYRPWQKNVPIFQDELTWVEYPRLFPKKLKTSNVLNLPATLSEGLSSGDGKFYAFLSDKTKPELTVVDIRQKETKTENITIPEKFFTNQKLRNFKLVSWVDGDKSILVSFTDSDNVSGDETFILVNLEEPKKSINLSDTFGVSLKDVIFVSDKTLYANVNSTVRYLDIENETISGPIAKNVDKFKIFEDYVLFVSKPDETNTIQVGYAKKDYKAPKIITSVAKKEDQGTFLDVGKYYDRYYIMVSNGNVAHLYKTKSLKEESDQAIKLKDVVAMKTKKPIIYTNIISNGQLATIQSDDEFVTYNLEEREKSRSGLDAMSQEDSPKKLNYLDAYYFWREKDGKLQVFEFDGKNKNTLVDFQAKFGLTIDSDGKYIYYVDKNKDDSYSFRRLLIKV